MADRVFLITGASSGIGAVRRADEVRPRPVGPDLQLLVGGRAEGVRRGDDDGVAMLTEA